MDNITNFDHQEQEKAKAKEMAKGKGTTNSHYGKENACPVGSNRALAQRARRERERCERQQKSHVDVNLHQTEQDKAKAKEMDKGKGTTSSHNDKENSCPVESNRALAQRARRERERCEWQENSHGDVHLHQKEQETSNAKDLAMASSHNDMENACPMESNNNGISKAALAQLARHKREQQKRRENSHVEGHLQHTETNNNVLSKAALAQRSRRERERCERRHNTPRAQHERELQSFGELVEPTHEMSCRRARTGANNEIDAATEISPKRTKVEHPSCQPGTSYAPPMNCCTTIDLAQLA